MSSENGLAFNRTIPASSVEQNVVAKKADMNIEGEEEVKQNLDRYQLNQMVTPMSFENEEAKEMQQPRETGP